MRRPSGNKVFVILAISVMIAGSIIAASINPAETSPKCMPEYIHKHGKNDCVVTAKSSGTSIQVIEPDK